MYRAGLHATVAVLDFLDLIQTIVDGTEKPGDDDDDDDRHERKQKVAATDRSQ